MTSISVYRHGQISLASAIPVTSGSGGSASNYDTDIVTPSALDRLAILAVSSRKNAMPIASPTITSPNYTWAFIVGRSLGSGLGRISLYVGVPVNLNPEPIDIDFSGVTQNVGCAWVLGEASRISDTALQTPNATPGLVNGFGPLTFAQTQPLSLQFLALWNNNTSLPLINTANGYAWVNNQAIPAAITGYVLLGKAGVGSPGVSCSLFYRANPVNPFVFRSSGTNPVVGAEMEYA